MLAKPMGKHFSKAQLTKLFDHYSLPAVNKLDNITTSFSNDVQVINDKLVLKTWEWDKVKWYKKELFCLTALADRIPVLPKTLRHVA